jgi:hypothetical protein
MKLLSFLSNKKGPKKLIHELRFNRNHNTDQEQREALIQTGRQQFKKLEELGLKIPIAIL